MSELILTEKRKNKNFVIQNKFYLRKYGLINYKKFGKGVIVVNLLLLEKEILTEEDIKRSQASEDQEITLHQEISYIPVDNFWFKILQLKIKKRHQIDINSKYDLERQILVVFVKNASIDNFSIYALKQVRNKKDIP